MHTFSRWPGWLAVVLLAGAAGCAREPAPGARAADQPDRNQAVTAAADVQVKVVKYAELGDTVKRFKGKVVAVDFWATT